MDEKKSITQMMQEIADEMCDKYCKYPDTWDEDKEGVTLADGKCNDCPLNALAEQYLSEPQKAHALRAMVGVKPKFHKGKYGKQYDSHTCGNCGHSIDVINDYCPKCGYRLLWDNPRCLTDYPAQKAKEVQE